VTAQFHVGTLLGVALLALSLTAQGQTAVFDKARFLSLEGSNTLLGNITRSMEAVQELDAKKLASQSAIATQLGPLTAANLSPAVTPANTSDFQSYVLTRDLAAGAKDADPTLIAYLRWDEQRRISEKVMDEQLGALLKGRDGSRLDWTGHLQLASSVHTLTNDRLAASLATANAINERRLVDKKRQSDLFRQELDDDTRKAAEARLAAP
jgi:hypothetical protein